MPKLALRPETAYHLWLGAWGVAGAALLYPVRAAFRADTDGRTGWSAESGTLVAWFGIYACGYLALGGLAMGLAREVAALAPAQPLLRDALIAAFAPALLALLLLGLRRFVPEISPRRPHRVAPKGPFGFSGAGLTRAFAGAMLLTYGASFLWNGLLFLVKKAGLGDFSAAQGSVQALVSSRDPRVLVPIFLGAVIFAPVQEELFYRGGLFAALRARNPRRAAYALSGLLFALMHLNVAAFLPLAIFGAWLAWLYDTTADLRVPVATHALFNLNTVIWAILAPGAVTG